MSNDRFKKICDRFNLGNLTSAPTKVSGGLLHLMWHIKTDQGEFALKELNKKIVSSEKIINSYEITENIARSFFERGVPSAVSLKLQDKSLIEIDSNIFIAYAWIDGITINSDAANLQHTKKIGSLLARMHMLKLNTPDLPAPQWDINTNEHFEELANKSAEAHLPFAKSLQEHLPDIISWNNRYQQHIRELNHNLVVSHGDLDPKNVIWKNYTNPVLIDWESARLLNPTQEILNAALDWSNLTSGNINLTLFNSVISAYKEEGGRINRDEVNPSLWAIVGNWLNWMRYNIERSLGQHISTDEERQLGIKEAQTVLRTLTCLTNNIELITELT